MIFPTIQHPAHYNIFKVTTYYLQHAIPLASIYAKLALDNMQTSNWFTTEAYRKIIINEGEYRFSNA